MRRALVRDAVLMASLFLVAADAAGAELPQERVEFLSADMVTLRGTFYPAAQGRKAPFALLLHDVGERHHRLEWDALARQLQADGLSVLTFDFRGHGDSTSVEPAFWQAAENRQLIRSFRPTRPPETVFIKDMPAAYYPMLVNDVIAARTFLDHKNDAREGNAAEVIVIGAGEGATLGAMWLASECARFRAIGGFTPRLDAAPQARDVIAAVWLSLSPTLGRRAVPVLDWLRTAGRDHKVPMGFLHGDGDKTGTRTAERGLAAVKGRGAELDLTASRAVKDCDAVGTPLLSAAFETTELIRTYLGNVRENSTEPLQRARDFDAQLYFWNWGGVPVPAKLPQETSLRLLPLQGLGLR